MSHTYTMRLVTHVLDETLTYDRCTWYLWDVPALVAHMSSNHSESPPPTTPPPPVQSDEERVNDFSTPERRMAMVTGSFKAATDASEKQDLILNAASSARFRSISQLTVCLLCSCLDHVNYYVLSDHTHIYSCTSGLLSE